MNTEDQLYDRIKDLGDYITLKTSLNSLSGSTSRLVRREPVDRGDNWRLVINMLKQDVRFQIDPGSRWCPHCGETHPLKMFSKDESRKDGLRDWCKPCVAAEQKRRYWLKRDSDLMWKEWQKRHILRINTDETEIERAA